jgi:hypothetical protein
VFTSGRFGGRVALQWDLARTPFGAVRALAVVFGLVVSGFGAARVVHLEVERQRAHRLHAGRGYFAAGKRVVGYHVRRGVRHGFLQLLQHPNPRSGPL